MHQKSAPKTNSKAISLRFPVGQHNHVLKTQAALTWWGASGEVANDLPLEPNDYLGTTRQSGWKFSIFLCFRQEIDPGTSLDRRGSTGTSICTKSQPRRPILRPFRCDFRSVKKSYIKNPGVPDWVREGSLAGSSVRHHLALELVSGAEFWCKLMFRASPGDLGGSLGRFPA